MAKRMAKRIEISADERNALERLVRRRKVARGDAQRAEIVRRAADGQNNCEIAEAVGVTRQTVSTWRDRFAQRGMNGLSDEPRCGAPRKIGDDRIEAIIVKTLEEKPSDATHWSTRGMAKASGVSTSSVHPAQHVATGDVGAPFETPRPQPANPAPHNTSAAEKRRGGSPCAGFSKNPTIRRNAPTIRPRCIKAAQCWVQYRGSTDRIVDISCRSWVVRFYCSRLFR